MCSFMAISTILTLSCFHFITMTSQKLRFTIREGKGSKKLISNIVEELGLRNHESPANGFNCRISSPDRAILDLFTLNDAKCELSTSSEIDRDRLCLDHDLCCNTLTSNRRTLNDCKLNFKILYSSIRKTIDFCQIEIIVEDINDDAPKFPKSHYKLMISESAPLNSEYPLLRAEDFDAGSNGIKEYRIKEGYGVFQCRASRSNAYMMQSEEITATLKLIDRLNREAKSSYHLILYAIDGGVPAKTGTLAITVQVMDENDNAPDVNPSFSFSVKEDSPKASLIGKVTASDMDIEENALLKYSFKPGISSIIKQYFIIDENDGRIRLINLLDYDSGHKEYHIPVIVRDSGKPVKSTSTTVTIRVMDVNDHKPKIIVEDGHNRKPPQPEVMENSDSDTFVAFVSVKDDDSGVNGQVTCTNENPAFRLVHVNPSMDSQNHIEYKLVTVQSLDREASPKQTLRITCHDNGIPKLYSEKLILVNVIDQNDNSPRFSSSFINAHVAENMQPNTWVTTFNATDPDSDPQGRGLRYSLDDIGLRYFRLESQSGRLLTAVKFDRETQSSIQFSVFVRDSGEPPRNSSARVTVHIKDVNDCQPQFEKALSVFKIEEEQSPGQLVGVIVAKDLDEGDNGAIIYSIDDNKGVAQHMFSLERETGKIFTQSRLDREIQDEYDFYVTARDKGHPTFTSKAQVKVKVMDVNDNPPKFVYPTKLNHTVYCSVFNKRYTPIVKLTAIDNDIEGNAALLFFITGGNEMGIFELDPKTGDMILSRDLKETDVNDYRLTLKIQDNGDPQLSATSAISVVIDTKTPPQHLTGYGPPFKRGDNGPYFQDRGLILIICLVVVAIVLAFVFLSIIVWLKRKPSLTRRDGRHGRSHVNHSICQSDQGTAKRDIRLADLIGCDQLSRSMVPLGTLVRETKDGFATEKYLQSNSRLNMCLAEDCQEPRGDVGSSMQSLNHCRVVPNLDGGRGGSHDQLASLRPAGGNSAAGKFQESNGNYYQQLGCSTECRPIYASTAGGFRSCMRPTHQLSSDELLDSQKRSEQDAASDGGYQGLQPLDPPYSSLLLKPMLSADHQQHALSNSSPSSSSHTESSATASLLRNRSLTKTSKLKDKNCRDNCSPISNHYETSPACKKHLQQQTSFSFASSFV